LFNKYLLLLFFWTPGFAVPLLAQEYSYVNYTVKDGLACSTVYSMAQDKDGFIWFGTETGLSRFDGTHFRNFYTTDGLPDNEIIKLFVDAGNRVWIIPFKNDVCYYHNGKIHNRENDSLIRALDIKSEVISVIEDRQGNIVVAEAKCIHVIAKNGTIKNIREFGGAPFLLMQAGLNKNSVCRFIINLSDGNTVVDLGDHGLSAVRFMHVGPNSYNSMYISPQLEIYEDEDSLIFLHTRDSARFSIPLPRGFTGISRINDSSLALTAYSATLLFDIVHKKIIDSFLKNQTINGALEDAEGNLWFSSMGAGVQRLGSRDMLHYTFHRDNIVFPVFCVQKIDSILYVGTDRFYLWSSVDKGRTFCSMQIYERFSRGRIIAIAPAGKKKIIVGTDLGVFRLGVADKTCHLFWQRGAVKTLAVSGDSAVLDFSSINVRRMRLKDGKVLDTLWNTRSTCGCIQKSILYVGTLNGLYAIDADKKIVFLGDRYDILKARISSVQPGPGGALWIATYGEGLVIYKDNEQPTHITMEKGLTSNICRNLYIDGNDVWVGTDKGLNKITVRDTGYSMIQYSTADGLSSDIINTVYVEGNNVYVGTTDGLTCFNENKISKRSECELRMTGISIAGKSWPPDTTNFVLPYKDNDLQFEFVGISYKSAGSIRYRYELAGIDKNWKTTTQTSLHYPSLPAGSYDLQVVALNKFGVGSNTLHVHYVIRAPFWETGWFRLLFAGAVAGWLWLLFHYRLTRIRKKEAEKTATAMKIAELEQMALRSRMNPHFIFNCLNSIQLYVMDKDTRGANEFITNFSRLIRQTLDISARSRISLREEIDYLSTYLELEKKRFENKFVYKISVIPGIDRYSIPPMILQPYVENAIHHGIAHRTDKSGSIRIRIESDADYLICSIEDNGVGRALSAKYKNRDPVQFPSRGMELTERRIAILNSTTPSPICTAVEDIEDKDGQMAGTRVRIHFPLTAIISNFKNNSL